MSMQSDQSQLKQWFTAMIERLIEKDDEEKKKLKERIEDLERKLQFSLQIPKQS